MEPVGGPVDQRDARHSDLGPRRTADAVDLDDVAQTYTDAVREARRPDDLPCVLVHACQQAIDRRLAHLHDSVVVARQEIRHPALPPCQPR